MPATIQVPSQARAAAQAGPDSFVEDRIMHRDNGLLIDLPVLPAGITRKTLREFVRAGLADAGYHGVALSRAIPSCSIIRVTRLDTGKSQLKGLVRIWPAKAAMAAIDKLDGRLLLGRSMHVMRHLHSTEFAHDGTVSSRQGGTRGGELKIELVDD